MYGSSPTHIFSMWSSLAFMEAASRPFSESHILSICSTQLWLISIAECSRKPQTWRPPSQISPQWIQPIILSDCSSLEHNTAGTQLPLGGPIYCQVRRPHRLMLSVKTTAALTGIQEFQAPSLPPACGSEQVSNYQEILCKYILQRSLTLRDISTTRENSIAPTASIIVSTWQMSWRQRVRYAFLFAIEVLQEGLTGTNKSLQALRTDCLGWHFRIDWPGQVLRDLVHRADIFQMSNLVQ